MSAVGKDRQWGTLLPAEATEGKVWQWGILLPAEAADIHSLQWYSLETNPHTVDYDGSTTDTSVTDKCYKADTDLLNLGLHFLFH